MNLCYISPLSRLIQCIVNTCKMTPTLSCHHDNRTQVRRVQIELFRSEQWLVEHCEEPQLYADAKWYQFLTWLNTNSRCHETCQHNDLINVKVYVDKETILENVNFGHFERLNAYNISILKITCGDSLPDKGNFNSNVADGRL